MINLVELCADDEEQSDTPCAHGNLVEGHSVYCHNDAWAESPRKCRRTWYTGGDVRDEDCDGYKMNPKYPGGSQQWLEIRRNKAEADAALKRPA